MWTSHTVVVTTFESTVLHRSIWMQHRLDHFLMTRFGRQNHTFSATHYNTVPWSEYSITADAVFCFPCCQFHIRRICREHVHQRRTERLEETGIQTIQTYHDKSSRLACPEMVAYEKSREDGSVATKFSDAHKAHVSQKLPQCYCNLRQPKTSGWNIDSIYSKFVKSVSIINLSLSTVS